MQERTEPTATTPNAKVAERIADTIRSGEPLTVDQVGEVAATLGVTASSLLPPHGTSPIGDTSKGVQSAQTLSSPDPGTHGHPLTVMTTTDVCAFTGLDVDELRSLWQGESAPRRIRLGRTVVYTRRDVMEWMRSAGLQPTIGPRLATGPVNCAPWCCYDDDQGHPDRFFEEDQWCGSERLTVPLKRHREVDVDGLHVSAMRRPGDEPVITFDIGEAYGTEMTAGEAAQLVESLQLLLGLVGSTTTEAKR